MPRKAIKKKIDGLGPDDIKKIRSALRRVWGFSYPRRLVKERCIGPDGFPRCEKCKQKVPTIHVDHIKNVGDVDEGFIKRLFVPSKKLQALCKQCHNKKTYVERKAKRLKEAKKK